MKRYTTTRKKIDKSGKRVYSTTYYPQIPISDSDKFIHPVSGDRLDTLAYKYYGDITLWWIIAKANGLKGKVGVSVAATDSLGIYGELSGITDEASNGDDEIDWGAKLGAKFVF